MKTRLAGLALRRFRATGCFRCATPAARFVKNRCPVCGWEAS